MRIPHRLCLALWVAALAAPAWAGADEWLYTVEAGDTLGRIAERHLDNFQSWQALQKYNKVADPNQLKPGSTLRIPYALSTGNLLQVDVAWVRGQALRTAAGGSATPLKTGDRLRIGERLETGDNSAVTLRFADQSRVLVAANSRITLTHMLRNRQTGQTNTTLELEAGAAESVVQRSEKLQAHYTVRTPTLNLAVRGTRFRVAFDPSSERTRTEVSEGSVAADAQGRQVTVLAGQGTTAAMGQPPETPRPLPPAPVLGAAESRWNAMPVHMAWQDTGAPRYRVELLDASGEGQVADTTTARPTAGWPNLSDGNYQLRVRTVDANGFESPPTLHTLIVKTQPAPPLLRHPIGGAVLEGEKVAFRWARVSGVQNYRIQVSDNADFARIIAQVTQLPGAVSGMDMALPPGRYFWRTATATKNGGWGPDSTTEAFELRAGRGTILPDAGTLTLAWRMVRPGQQVQVQVAPTEDFAVPVVDSITDAPRLAIANATGSYFVRLRRIESDGMTSAYEATQRIQPDALR